MTAAELLGYLPVALCGLAFMLLVADPGTEGASSRVAFVCIAAAFALLLAGVEWFP